MNELCCLLLVSHCLVNVAVYILSVLLSYVMSLLLFVFCHTMSHPIITIILCFVFASISFFVGMYAAVTIHWIG